MYNPGLLSSFALQLIAGALTLLPTSKYKNTVTYNDVSVTSTSIGIECRHGIVQCQYYLFVLVFKFDGSDSSLLP